METVNDLISDEQIDASFSHFADEFKPYSPRDVVKYALLKFICGYESGRTIRTILQDLCLLHPNCKVTELGKRYTYLAFKHSSQQYNS